jgi:hypothetical protein
MAGRRWVAYAAVDDAAMRAVQAVAPTPHGLFGVTIVLDGDGMPYVTRVDAGWLPEGSALCFTEQPSTNFACLALQSALDALPLRAEPLLNPFPQHLVLLHGVDTEPLLVPSAQLDKCADELAQRRATMDYANATRQLRSA